MTGFDIFAIAFVLLIILTLFAGVKTVPQGFDWTIERFGKFTRTLSPGLNIIIPYFDRVGRKMNMMEQVISIPEQEVITKDNATVTVDGVAFFQVFDAAKASYEVSDLNQAIIMLTMTNIRSVMGSMDLDQVLSHRDEINERLLRVVDAAVSPWGLKVNRIEIKDIVPPADLVEAMGRQMKAERVKRADILQAEGQRQSEILRAEGAKQGQILQAEGRREAAFRDAEARERSAEAEAKATQMVSEAIAKGDVAALNYFIADKYIKAFGQLADSPNQKIIMLPIEAMSILGSLAGIGEIAKATFGESAASAQAAARRGSVPSTDRRRNAAATLTHVVPALAGTTVKQELYHGRDVFDAWHLELADLRPAADGAGTAGARRVPALARAGRAAGRVVVVRAQPVVAAADPDVRRVRRRRGAAVAARRAPQLRREPEQSVPQQALGRAGRPRLHAGEADRRRRRHGADRRHDLARRRPRCPRRQPRPHRACGWRQSDGGGGLDSVRACPGRGAAFFMPLGSAGTVPGFVTIPVLRSSVSRCIAPGKRGRSYVRPRHRSANLCSGSKVPSNSRPVSVRR